MIEEANTNSLNQSNDDKSELSEEKNLIINNNSNSESEEKEIEINRINNIDYCPQISNEILKNLENIFNNAKKKKYKKIVLGVIKFNKDGNDYIHCPIKKIINKGADIVFGVCKFPSLLDNAVNRRKLSLHKYHFHYCGLVPDSQHVNVCLKTTKSLEESVKQNIALLLKEEIQNKNENNCCIHLCIHCNKENKIQCTKILGNKL